ncbi:hypothetical protein RhiLY_01476 [Ceratobasidium sp. AG-Ba]|nr:hypothetical protein RhiLY_01476 [Ceratobasidium sp. AG-Ba]
MMLLDAPNKPAYSGSIHSLAVIDDDNKKLGDERPYSDAGPSVSNDHEPLLADAPLTDDIEAAPIYRDLPDDQPPVFAPYQAEFEVTSSGDIFSHDRHLNEDGEALYRFLLTHASTPPNLLVRCKGTHPETRVTHVTRSETRDGQTVTRTEPQTHTETVIDFNFSIDLSHHLYDVLRVYWTVPDDEPAYRGGMSREVLTDMLSGVRRVPRKVLRAGKVWHEKREKRGLPPWLSPTNHELNVHRTRPEDELAPMRSELSLRQWADRYCASRKPLKEFTFRKIPYGWDFEWLTAAVRGTIQEVYHIPQHTVTVEFTTFGDKVSIRPPSSFARALSKTWVVVLLWILFIYPFIFLYRRLRGGKWEVAGVAFPLQSWSHCEDSVAGESAEAYRVRTYETAARRVGRTASDWYDERILAESSKGVSELIGLNGENWYNSWKSTIA